MSKRGSEFRASGRGAGGRVGVPGSFEDYSASERQRAVRALTGTMRVVRGQSKAPAAPATASAPAVATRPGAGVVAATAPSPPDPGALTRAARGGRPGPTSAQERGFAPPPPCLAARIRSARGGGR